MFLLITTAILTSIRPCISYILIGELDNIMPTHFPGINDKEITGYVIVAVFHLYILFIFVIGTAGSDLGLMTFVVHSYAMADIFQNAVNELNGLIRSKKINTSDENMHPSDTRTISMPISNTNFEANSKSLHLRVRISASLQNLIWMHYDFIKSMKPNLCMYAIIYNSNHVVLGIQRWLRRSTKICV